MSERHGWLTPELRATAYYFTFFMTSGASTFYGGIWFANVQGLSSSEIGLIGSLPTFIMLILNLVVGRLADRARDWRQVIVIGAVLGGLIPIGLFWAHGFLPILIVWTLTALPLAAIGPVQDAATIRLTRRNGTDFGFIRAWGTVGFMAVIVVTGQLVTLLGGMVFLPFYVGLGLLRGVIALGLPNFRAPKEEQTLARFGASRMREVMKPWFLLPLVGWSTISATHLVLNSFQALLWEQQGIPDFVIAILIALGAASEATMMFVFKRFVGRFPARAVILASAVVSTLRWVALAFAPDVPLLVVLQLLHSVTFAMGYMGCVHFIANWTSEGIAAEAQSFFQVLQQVFGVIAVTAFGVLMQMFGFHAYFGSAAFAGVGAVLILISMRLMPPKTQSFEIHT